MLLDRELVVECLVRYAEQQQLFASFKDSLPHVHCESCPRRKGFVVNHTASNSRSSSDELSLKLQPDPLFSPTGMSTNRFERVLAPQINQKRRPSSKHMSPGSRSGLSFCFVWLVIVILCPAGKLNAAEDINTILDKQETDIRTLAGLVLQNYRNSSALAEGCEVSCSRRNCQPLTTDNFVCGYTPDNPDCRGPDNSCTSTMLDWDQSVVTGSIDANLENETPNCDMRKTICSQKQLDTQFFINEGRSTDLVAGVTYFGASNGIFRTYPGKVWNQTACPSFDLRVRPWYVAATALAKDIVVMLDSGPSSGQDLAIQFPGVSAFAAFKNITSRMLPTLTYEDSISIFALTNVATSVGSKTSVTNGVNASASVFGSLNAEIQSLPDPGDQSNVEQADLTSGLQTALNQFDKTTSNLKIVIFLTTGDFTGESLDESLVEDLESSKVTVFVFRILSTASSGGNDTTTTQLQNATCTMKGGYAEQHYDHQDPYVILQPFYSYVARLRFDQNGQRPFWVRKFHSYSAQGQVVAVAMPVFDGGVLLGVASRNIFVDYLQKVTSNLDQVLSTRNTVGTLLFSGNSSITTLCGQVGLPDQSCPVILSGYSSVTGFCTNIKTLSNPLDLLCCRDSCPWPFSGSGGHDKDKVLKIALSTSISLAILLLATICVVCLLGSSCRRKQVKVIKTTFGRQDSQGMFNKPL